MTTTTDNLTDKQVVLLVSIIVLLVEIQAVLNAIERIEKGLDRLASVATRQLFLTGEIEAGTEALLLIERGAIELLNGRLTALRTALRLAVGALNATL